MYVIYILYNYQDFTYNTTKTPIMSPFLLLPSMKYKFSYVYHSFYKHNLIKIISMITF